MITNDDYEILSAWFVSAMVPLVANQILSAFQPQISGKVNRCEEIYSVLDKDFGTNDNKNVAKMKLSYQSGTSGQIDSNGYISGETSVVSGVDLQKRFEKTGDYLVFSFDPLPASLDYVESNATQLKNVMNSSLDEHNKVPMYNAVHVPAFNSFLTCAVLPEIYAKHDKNAEAHTNLSSLTNYYNKSLVDLKDQNMLATAVSQANSMLTLHDESTDLSTHQARFNLHNTDGDAHTNLSSLTNYYTKKEIDTKENSIKNYVNNENNTLKAYTNNTINTHNTNENAHTVLFNKKANLENPVFSKNITIKENAYVSGNVITPNIKFENNSITLSNSTLTLTSNKAIIGKSNAYNVTILDSNGNSNFRNIKTSVFSALNGTVDTVNDSNGKAIPNIDWCKTAFSNIMPYGSMPDYANLKVLQQGDVSYIWKVNVPGYITVTFGHCSDVDYVLWAASKPEYLRNLKQNASNIFKLSEGYGNGDRDQSSICVPILPGTQTYIRPTIDYSKGQVAYMSWLFVPCIATREFESKRNMFIQKITENLGTGHTDKHTTGYTKAADIFNTSSNANIWMDNLR
jgi:hypothetical protein